jgi:hypothetical protein
MTKEEFLSGAWFTIGEGTIEHNFVPLREGEDEFYNTNSVKFIGRIYSYDEYKCMIQSVNDSYVFFWIGVMGQAFTSQVSLSILDKVVVDDLPY